MNPHEDVEPVSETDEKKIRDEIDEITHPTRASSKLLHIPDGDSIHPLCDQYNTDRWRREPVNTWPIGHTEMCRYCVKQYFEDQQNPLIP